MKLAWGSRPAMGLVVGLLILAGCSGPLDNTPDEGDIPPGELEANAGEVGLVVDVRQIARRGYQPATAEIGFSGDYAAYGAEVDVDPDTTVATLSIPVEDLTADEIEALANGVDVTITVRDASGSELATYTGSETVDSSNQPIEVTTSLTAVYPGA